MIYTYFLYILKIIFQKRKSHWVWHKWILNSEHRLSSNYWGLVVWTDREKRKTVKEKLVREGRWEFSFELTALWGDGRSSEKARDSPRVTHGQEVMGRDADRSRDAEDKTGKEKKEVKGGRKSEGKAMGRKCRQHKWTLSGRPSAKEEQEHKGWKGPRSLKRFYCSAFSD